MIFLSGIEEKVISEFYKINIFLTGDNILKLAEILDEKKLNDINIILKEKSNNTYIFTKAIAEQLLQQYAQDLPVGLFRPAIGMND